MKNFKKIMLILQNNIRFVHHINTIKIFYTIREIDQIKLGVRLCFTSPRLDIEFESTSGFVNPETYYDKHLENTTHIQTKNIITKECFISLNVKFSIII